MMLDAAMSAACHDTVTQALVRRDPLTILILRALAEADGSSSEIAAELELHWKIVSGTLSNLRKQRMAKVIAQAGRRRGYAFLYRITNAGRAHVRGYIQRHGVML